jgi:hypothetical protein
MRRAAAALAALAALLLPAAAQGAPAGGPSRASGRPGDRCRLEMKGSGTIALTRPHGEDALSIEIAAEFEATLNLVGAEEGWIAHDGEITATVAWQKLRLRLLPPAPSPNDEVYLEVNGAPIGWGRRSGLAAVPLIGVPVALGTATGTDARYRVEIGEAGVVVRLPGGDELLTLQVERAPQDPGQAARPWKASGELKALTLPTSGEESLVVDRVAWNGEGRAGGEAEPFKARVTVETEFGLAGGTRGTLKGEVEGTVVRLGGEAG